MSELALPDSQLPVNRDWRIVQELQRGCTEEEARDLLSRVPINAKVYAINSLHELIEASDGPVTTGRPIPNENVWR